MLADRLSLKATLADGKGEGSNRWRAATVNSGIWDFNMSNISQEKQVELYYTVYLYFIMYIWNQGSGIQGWHQIIGTLKLIFKLTNFSNFQLNICDPTPLHFVSYEQHKKSSHNTLQWATMTKYNGHFWEINLNLTFWK